MALWLVKPMIVEAIVFASALTEAVRLFVWAYQPAKKWKTIETLRRENQIIRRSSRYKAFRLSVLKRDNFTCQWCGIKGGYLEVDHIKPFAYFPELRFDINNCQTLCPNCHRKTDTYGHKAKLLYGNIQD